MKKILLSAVMGFSTLIMAQEEKNKNIDYQIKAHYGIGGSSPIAWGLPQEIRKIEGYNPTLNIGAEMNATKWLSDEQKWGVRLGVRFENRGMKTRARVKNYHTEISQDSEKIEGYFTGLVQTNLKNTLITIPVSAVYKISPKLNLYAGLYASGLVDKSFTGQVSDGYLHQDTPIGNRILFEGQDSAPYDYSDELRSFLWGGHIGAEWYLGNHFFLSPEVNYGFNQIFKSNFNTISYSLHNIYLNLGFGYKF